ncbi:hypothetical protein BH23BAC4_BH23BAC4_05780 [soil metagenome]
MSVWPFRTTTAPSEPEVVQASDTLIDVMRVMHFMRESGMGARTPAVNVLNNQGDVLGRISENQIRDALLAGCDVRDSVGELLTPAEAPRAEPASRTGAPRSDDKARSADAGGPRPGEGDPQGDHVVIRRARPSVTSVVPSLDDKGRLIRFEVKRAGAPEGPRVIVREMRRRTG